MKRVFIAVNLPGEIKGELGNLAREIKDSFPEEVGDSAAKWVKRDNLHITLLFIGDVKEEKIPQVCQIVKQTVQGWQPFGVKFKKVCYGPPRSMPPRLIWVELEKNKDLECLSETLKKKMTESNILLRSDNRPFSGHITLARIKAWVWKRIEPEERPQVERDIELNFKVNSIEVMESTLHRTGAEYKILSSISFS